MTIRQDNFQLSSGITVSAANQSTSSVEVGAYAEAVIYVTITNKTGTAPTLDLDVEGSLDDVTFAKLDDVTQINDPTLNTVQIHRVTAPFGKYIRLNNPTTPGGSASPSITYSARVHVKDR